MHNKVIYLTSLPIPRKDKYRTRHWATIIPLDASLRLIVDGEISLKFVPFFHKLMESTHTSQRIHRRRSTSRSNRSTASFNTSIPVARLTNQLYFTYFVSLQARKYLNMRDANEVASNDSFRFVNRCKRQRRKVFT